MPDLVLNHVSYRYKSASSAAVKEADCVFSPGRMYAIVGPSGSGKSTLLSMVCGLDLPTEGEITFGGKSLAEMDLDRYRRQDISMIFQQFHLFPLMTAVENVCYPMELIGIATADAIPRAKALLERVGITEEQHGRYPGRLSGGEQQRVAIARSLAAGAKTLLADEPTGNLDEANTGNIMSILKALAHDDDYCVVVVTHDLEAAAVADVIFRMRDGVLTRET